MVLSLMSGALVWYWIPVSAKDKKDKEKKDRFAGPISSQPLDLTADGESLLVVNPDNNSLTIFDVKKDKKIRRVDEVPVGIEPNGVAVLPGGKTAYVANTISGTVSVIKFSKGQGHVVQKIEVGTEPYAWF